MTLRVLVAVSGAAWESHLVSALERQRSTFTVVRRCVDVPDLLASAASGQAQVALLSSELSRLDADVVSRLVDSGVQPIGVVTEGATDEAERLRRIGVSAQVDFDRPDLLLSTVGAGSEAVTVDSSQQDRRPEAGVNGTGHRPRGRVVAVWGPTGAPGRTTVACGLAAELAALDATTLLIDADVYGGSVAQVLGILDESSGLLAAARSANNGALDVAGLAANARQLKPSLRVLTGLPRADRWPELRPAALSGVLATARALASFVVVDVGFCLELDEELSFDTAAPRRNGATLLVLEQADVVLAVGSADPVGLTRLTRAMVDLSEAVPGASVRVCVNRMRSSLGWSEDEVTETVSRLTGVSRVLCLPADPAACDKAAVRGKLLSEVAPESPLRSTLRAIATELAEVETSHRRGIRLAAALRRPRAGSHVRSAR